MKTIHYVPSVVPAGAGKSFELFRLLVTDGVSDLASIE